MSNMRITVTKAPPIEAKHGIRQGRVFDVLRRAGADYVVLGDAAEEVRVHRRECIETTNPVTEPPLLPAKAPECAHPGCRNAINPDDDHCAGCNQFICEEHSTNDNAMGNGHNVEEHWEDEGALTRLDDEGDEPDDDERDEA